jgi:sporulation protein YlmC with PRC-barrel domain
MFRKLMLTTAIVALTAGGALAQTATPTPAPAQDAAPVQQPATVKPLTDGSGQLATNLIGENVYNSSADDATSIGDVNDIVIGADGAVSQVIVGVGGFLGIGEKDVAIDYKSAELAERNGDRWLVVKMSKEELESAPAFDRTPYAVKTQETAMAPPPAPSATTPTPATQDSAQAPAATEQDTAAAPTSEQPAADPQTTAAIDKSMLTPVPETDLSAEKLNGTTVYGADEANIGEIGDVILTTDGKVEAVVLDVGGFLGVGEKPVAVSMENLAFMADKDGNQYLYTTFTKEQLEAHPAYDKDSYASNRQNQLLKTTQ